jgi:hypothetical protein
VQVGGGVLPAADGVAVRQVALHSRLPPDALSSPPILRPNSYCTLGGESWGGQVARLAGVGRERGESTPPLSTNVGSELTNIGSELKGGVTYLLKNRSYMYKTDG